MKIVFIAHQISGDVEANLESACLWIRWAIMARKVLPIAPYIYLMKALDEGKIEERKIGRDLGLHMIQYAEELWICGPIPKPDSFVWREVEEASNQGIPIVDYTDLIFSHANPT